ncbi:MAG: NCS2 family permease [Paludibacteraceae bacterium]|nr:NCS2 family permease [Paludibacteraceae bacterium]
MKEAKNIDSLRLKAGSLVGFVPGKHRVLTELGAGVTTFIAMAYILAVNPAMLAESGMDHGAAFVATALAAAVGTLLCAFYVRMPFSQAPAMGANAFFVYTICLTMGYTWQMALTGVLLEGVLFVILSVTHVREWIVRLIPPSIQLALGAGIGLLIALLGFTNSGLVVAHPSTLVTLGDLHSPSVLLALGGIVLMSVLMSRRVPGSLLIGIVVVTLAGIPLGVTHLSAPVFSLPPSLSPVFCAFQWDKIFSMDMLLLVLTLLSMDMFDTLGTLMALGRSTGELNQGVMNRALLSDAVATVTGAVLGTSTVGTYVESSAGIRMGGRTGLTSVFTAFFFVLSLFMAPLFLAVPGVAVGPALVLVGVGMLSCTKDLMSSSDFSETLPALVTMLVIPFTFSIANGIVLGMICYCLTNLFTSGMRKLSWPMLILTAILSLKFIL